ncbi:MAG: hypothetical protein O7E52_09435, partial [Candidatus Poribacteria bacterium]|nr:hypothetical protein [Candidatus Poribacteria bacterium]
KGIFVFKACSQVENAPIQPGVAHRYPSRSEAVQGTLFWSPPRNLFDAVIPVRQLLKEVVAC